MKAVEKPRAIVITNSFDNITFENHEVLIRKINEEQMRKILTEAEKREIPVYTDTKVQLSSAIIVIVDKKKEKFIVTEIIPAIQAGGSCINVPVSYEILRFLEDLHLL